MRQGRVTHWLERADSTLCRTGRTGDQENPLGPRHLECGELEILDNPEPSTHGPKPKNADFPLLKVERPCCDTEEGARSKGRPESAFSASRPFEVPKVSSC